MDCPRTLGGLQDKGTSAENLIDIGRRPIGSARRSRSGWAAGETIPALTERALELETQLASVQADLAKEQRRLASYSDFDVVLNDAVASAYRKADTIRSRAQSEANAILERAVSERRLLQKEVDRLRQERDELQDEISSLRRGELAVMPAAIEPDAGGPAFDLGTAVAEEMRAMLTALLEEVRGRPGPSQAVALAAPTETAEPILNEPVEQLLPELSPATEIESEDILAETSLPIVEEHVEEFRKPAAPLGPSEELGRDVVEVGPPQRVFDEYIEEFVEPRIAEPVDEYVEELRAAEGPPASEIEIDLPHEPSEPIVDEYIVELRPEISPETPAVDANVEALWEAAPPAAAPTPFDSVSFITDEFIAATRPGPSQEADVDTGALPPLIDVPAFAEAEAPPPITEPMSAPTQIPASEPAVSEERGVRQIQVRISPVHSFPRLIEIQGRIQSLSSVHALQLRDFRNGVATFAVGVAEAISPQEFGAVIQMLENLHLRLEGTGQNSVELRAEDDVPSA